jgi:5-methyltetrahydropteroyltriglutamate--homocysteine methyltransferase
MTTISTHTLGYPRIGARRELKTALESYWRGAIPAAELEQVGAGLRAAHWEQQRRAGLAFATVGDFSLYDQVADHIQLFGCEPERFGFDGGSTAGDDPLQRYFAMARGDGREACCASHGSGGHALDMTKWFDTNYHYLVPEFAPSTAFTLHAERLLGQVAEARALGHRVKAALIGPLTFLWLGKERGIERL